ncbi:hypothetical protein JTB14_011396 [Gonioctena quinquepunctata]|nr:hypothetical protein JTB14_011396 [Gonioctena quinquepunctata]
MMPGIDKPTTVVNQLPNVHSHPQQLLNYTHFNCRILTFVTEMKTQKVTKSSKFTQATPNDNEYRDYQNIGMTVLPSTPCDEGNQNVERIFNPDRLCHNVNKSSELLLKGNYKNQESLHEIQR